MLTATQKTLFDEPEHLPETPLLPVGDVRVRLSGPDRPAWLSADAAARIAAGRSVIRFSRPEKKVLRKQRTLPPSVWAEKYRTLTMSVFNGPWRNATTPWLVGIMDAAAFPSVREVDLCKGPQTGGTEAVHNIVGSLIDQAPGPVMYVFPDQTMAEENSRDRIMPMIKESPRLKGYLSGNRNDESAIRINLAHMPVYMAWASSVARLGNKPIRYMIGDEISKYLSRFRTETNSLKLMDARLTTYRDISKFIRLSTPGTGDNDPIWTGFWAADIRFYFWPRCPECGALQPMTFDRIKFGDCRDPNIMRKTRLARYACAGCGAMWDDFLRDRAVAEGCWMSAPSEADKPYLELFGYLEKFRPRHIGFHLPAWISRFVSLSESAAAFLETLTGDVEKRKNFTTQHEAKPYIPVILRPVETQFKAAVLADLPAQTVPDAAVALTCGVDCQKIGFYFAVRAWARDFTSWLIHYGKLATWLDVEQLVFETTYPVMGSERRMAIARMALDTGGSQFDPEQSMTEEAYFWLRKNGAGRGARCWGIKGASWEMPNKIRVSKPFDRTPAGKAIPGSLQILTLDTDKFKDQFFYCLDQAVLETAGDRVRPAYLHAGVGEEYFAHITAEEKREDDRGVVRWMPIKNRRRDWLDCEVYAAAAADPEWPEGGIQLMVPPAPAAPIREARDRSGDDRPGWTRRGNFELPSWIRNR